jgi:serine/threonine protein kinase
VAFEILTGTPLFEKDLSDDNLYHSDAKSELINWNTLESGRLSMVLQNLVGDCGMQLQEDAKHFVAWCLRREPDERPTIDELLTHRFLNPIQEPTALGLRAPDAEKAKLRKHYFFR